MALQIYSKDNQIHISGSLDESADPHVIHAELTRCSNEGVPLSLNFEQVQRVNSAGTYNLLQALPKNQPLKFSHCPIVVVELLNMLFENFLGDQGTVTSFYAPFINEDTGDYKTVLLEVGKDIDLLPSYDEYECPPRQIDGIEYTPDFDTETYFSFLAYLGERDK